MKVLFTAMLILALPLATHAAVILSDGFEGEAQGLNVVPTGWTITNGGTVDIIGFGCHAGVNCVDLDGSSGLAGILNHTFAATLGVNYTLTFWLAGSQRGDVNEVDVLLGSASQNITGIASSQVSTLHTLSWTSTLTGTSNITFHNLGGDNVGAILDDVLLTTDAATGVPEPASVVLISAGLAGVVALRRRMTIS